MYSECVTVWSDAPTTVTSLRLELRERRAQLVVGLADLQAEVVEAHVATGRGWARRRARPR